MVNKKRNVQLSGEFLDEGFVPVCGFFAKPVVNVGKCNPVEP